VILRASRGKCQSGRGSWLSQKPISDVLLTICLKTDILLRSLSRHTATSPDRFGIFPPVRVVLELRNTFTKTLTGISVCFVATSSAALKAIDNQKIFKNITGTHPGSRLQRIASRRRAALSHNPDFRNPKMNASLMPLTASLDRNPRPRHRQRFQNTISTAHNRVTV